MGGPATHLERPTSYDERMAPARWRKLAFALLILTYFIYFNCDEVWVRFAPDDMMNMAAIPTELLETPVFDAAAPLFKTFAGRAFYLGSYGAGARMKLVANLALGLHRAVLAETLAFAHACEVSPVDALEVLKAGAAYSRVMDDKGQKMLDHDFSVEAKLSQHLKDVRLILAAANAKHAKAPLSQVHRQLLEGLEAAGYGEMDNSAIIMAYE